MVRAVQIISLCACMLSLALEAQEPARLIPRELVDAPGSSSSVAPDNPITRSAMSESSPFAAITATDPRLEAESRNCISENSNELGALLVPCGELRRTGLNRFIDPQQAQPLSAEEKAHLAIRNVVVPGNLATLGASSAFTVLTNSHTGYGPGFAGLGRSFGYGLVQDATGQFFGTWAIPALAREDPRYHRDPHAPVRRRLLHAISHTFVAQGDDGRAMLNYSTLATYPISAEISNLYVPGIHGNGPSTVARFLTGYATDPVDNVLAEFLPDVARHVHVHVLFTQQILNQLSSEQYPSLP